MKKILNQILGTVLKSVVTIELVILIAMVIIIVKLLIG